MSKKKVIITVLIVLFVIVGTIAGICIYGVKDYIDRNTWSTIDFKYYDDAKGKWVDVDKVEFLRYDTYKLGDTTLTINKIEHTGETTISFSPNVRDIYDASVVAFRFKEGQDIRFYIDGKDTEYSMMIVDHRYR